MCNNCIHKPVCSKYIACGEVKSCEHFKEERRASGFLLGVGMMSAQSVARFMLMDTSPQWGSSQGLSLTTAPTAGLI